VTPNSLAFSLDKTLERGALEGNAPRSSWGESVSADLRVQIQRCHMAVGEEWSLWEAAYPSFWVRHCQQSLTGHDVRRAGRLWRTAMLFEPSDCKARDEARVLQRWTNGRMW